GTPEASSASRVVPIACWTGAGRPECRWRWMAPCLVREGGACQGGGGGTLARKSSLCDTSADNPRSCGEALACQRSHARVARKYAPPQHNFTTHTFGS